MDKAVKPEFIINELLEQIKKLQFDNAVLKYYIASVENKDKEESGGIITI